MEASPNLQPFLEGHLITTYRLEGRMDIWPRKKGFAVKICLALKIKTWNGVASVVIAIWPWKQHLAMKKNRAASVVIPLWPWKQHLAVKTGIWPWKPFLVLVQPANCGSTLSRLGIALVGHPVHILLAHSFFGLYVSPFWNFCPRLAWLSLDSIYIYIYKV